jgi:hypothetical protein
MTTTPTASPELPDLDHLEALARAATPGEWKAMPHGRIVGGPLREYVNGSTQQQLAMLNVTIHDQDDEDVPDRQQANTEFIAAANPEQVLALIAIARRAQPEGEAPQAEPVGEVVLFGRECKEISWAKGKLPPVGAKLYTHPPAATLSPLCGAQHADVSQLVKERDGWKEESEHQKALYERACESVEMLRDHERKQFWAWQGDGSDNLASMSRSMTILIRADQLRALAALTHEEGLSFGRRHRASMAEEITDLRAQQAAAPEEAQLDPGQVQSIADRIRNSAGIQRAAQLDGGQEGSESNG